MARAPGRTRWWLATHDVVLVAHLLLMAALVVLARPPPGTAWVAAVLVAGAALLIASAGWARGARAATGERPGVRSATYRVAVLTALLTSYLTLRWSLPIVAPGSRDAPLALADAMLLGEPVTLRLEPLMAPWVVEWLAFFYFAYYVMCALYAAITLRPGAAPSTSAELAIGTSLVFGIGQLGYVVLPAYGPYHHLADQYAGPLRGGFFWHLVIDTVLAGGALKDIFPSLHTAASVWFFLFAWRRARLTRARPWVIGAAATGVFTGQIVVSTVALRWHYTVDVVAGVILAAAVAWAAPRLATLEDGWRRRRGRPGAWDLGDPATLV